MTILDLARKLKVSTSTISRAFSRPEAVAQGTRERVMRAAKRFGYRPNEIARSLRTRKTKTIGVIVPDITNWFFGAIVKAVEDVAINHGYAVLICNADEDPSREANALSLLLQRQVSGMINCSTGADCEIWRALLPSGMPLVELDRRSGLQDVDIVVLDDEKAAELAAVHLIELGHRAIATVAGPQHLSHTRARLTGLRETLRRASIPLPAEHIEYGDLREQSGYDATRKLLALRPRPSALFIVNSEMTGGAIKALNEGKIKIPNDLSVIGFDDARWTRYLNPPLTMIVHPTVAMGRRAIELLLARLEGRKKHSKRRIEIFAPELVVRESTAALARVLSPK